MQAFTASVAHGEHRARWPVSNAQAWMICGKKSGLAEAVRKADRLSLVLSPLRLASEAGKIVRLDVFLFELNRVSELGLRL